MDISPLIFEPIFKPKIWGGHNLARLLGKKLPSDPPTGESWECADLEEDQSIVARGPAKGKTLHELVETWGTRLLGRAEPTDGRFPLLFKFLDATANLSIQVHPDPETARRLGGHVRVKHESWHILEARGDACIYRGLKAGSTVETLRQCMAESPARIVDHLNRIPVQPGQTYYLPSGTLHALGAGVVVAEIQTPSDITYRLYDWDRTRPAGDAGLDVEQGLACIRTDIDFAPFERRSHVSSLFTTVSRLVTCPSFVIEKVRFSADVEQEIPYAELVCWIVLDGCGEVIYGKDDRIAFSRGDTLILPAALEKARLNTLSDCGFLEVTVPTRSDLADYPRPDRSELSDQDGTQKQPIQIHIDSSSKQES